MKNNVAKMRAALEYIVEHEWVSTAKTPHDSWIREFVDVAKRALNEPIASKPPSD